MSCGFTQAARSMPNVPFQVVRKFDTEKIRNFELKTKYFFTLDDIKEHYVVEAYCTCERLGDYTKC